MMKSVSTSKSKNTNFNQPLYIHDIKGKLIKTTTIKDYSIKTGKTPSNIYSIAISVKGYGFINNNFISLKIIDRLLTPEEVISLFNKWLIKGYDRNITKLKGMYKNKFDEEYYSLALLYITESIYRDRSVNDFEQALIYKYRTSMIDCERTHKLRHDNGLSPDFYLILSSNHKVDENQDSPMFIETLCMEGDSLFDTKKNYDCVEDYNSIKRFDVIGYILKEQFDSQEVDMFVDILQSQYDFVNLKSIPNFKYSTLIRKYKDVIVSLKKKDIERKKLSNTNYLIFIVKKCWNVFVRNIERVKRECEYHTFKSIDDYGLNELINN